MSGFSFVSVGRATTVTIASFLLLAATAAPETGAAPMDTSPLQTSAPIKLFYDEQLIREGFPSPALRVTVGEITAWLLVDTGASVHTLASWFVHDSGIQGSSSTITASDSTGREVSMGIARDIRLRIDGAPSLTIPEAAVADFPSDFQRLRLQVSCRRSCWQVRARFRCSTCEHHRCKSRRIKVQWTASRRRTPNRSPFVALTLLHFAICCLVWAQAWPE